jgi:hypothetical protein
VGDYFDILGASASGRSEQLASLKPIQSIDVDEFLAILNRDEPTVRPAIADSEQGGLAKVWWYTPPASVREVLRGLVDEWINSGYVNGVDVPRDRNLERAPNVTAAAFQFSTRGKIRLLPDSDGDGLAVWLDHGIEPGNSERFLLQKRETFAVEQVTFMLLSDLRFKIAKCRRQACGSYFLLEQWNRQYKSGTLCGDCKIARRSASAGSATKEARRDAEEALFDLVARKFAEQLLRTPAWHRRPELKSKIVEYLNAKIKRSEELSAVYMTEPRKGITGKWVARSKNRIGIEAAVKKGTQ